jgi:carboxyl-terminal processing protease
VAIELLHPGETTPVLLRVQRAVISQPSVRGARRDSGGRWRDPMLDEREAIGYIRVMREAKDTAAGVATLLQELERRGARGLILDLRDNVGGLRRAAMDVVDLFLDAGPVLEVVGDGKTEVLETRAGGNLDLPMVVLINDGTISAGELIAAALRDRDRAVLVGQRTFGKGMVQRLFPLGEGAGGLTLTVGVHRRLGGRNLEKHGQPEDSEEWGVAPDAGMEVLPEREQDEAQREQMLDRDAPIVPTPEDLAEPALPDPQLERALVVLRQRLAPR